MKKFPVADGTIEKLICNRNTLIMEFTDWQERRWEITFNDLVAFQGLGAVGTELCDMYEEENTWLSQEATRLEPGETGITYCFTSSNGGETILRVVAGSYSIQEI